MQQNQEKSRFEYEQDGHIAYADYQLKKGVLNIPYVFAPNELRGTGAAGKLMQYVAEWAKENDLKIRPICGYAAAWLKKHPHYRAI